MNAKKNYLRAEKMSYVASKWQSLSNSDHVMCRMRLKTYERPSLQCGPRRRKKSKLKKEKYLLQEVCVLFCLTSLDVG